MHDDVHRAVLAISAEDPVSLPKLTARLRFETLLVDLSSRFVNLPAGDVDREIGEASTSA